jgi:hypothetical protein
LKIRQRETEPEEQGSEIQRLMVTTGCPFLVQIHPFYLFFFPPFLSIRLYFFLLPAQFEWGSLSSNNEYLIIISLLLLTDYFSDFFFCFLIMVLEVASLSLPHADTRRKPVNRLLCRNFLRYSFFYLVNCYVVILSRQFLAFFFQPNLNRHALDCGYVWNAP